MHIVSFVTQKGGTGKSSLAVSLAVAAAESGLKVVVLDIDPQGTTGEWYKRRTAEAPEVHSLAWTYLPSRLYTFDRQGYDLAIVDTPGADSHAASEAMRQAHFCLLPVRPSVADIEASKPTVRYLNERDKPFAFVLNQCPTGGRTSRTSNARMALQLLGSLCDPTLAHRSDHVDALASGLGVTEFNPFGKAADEVRAVLQWLAARLRRSDAIETADEGGAIPRKAVS
ncbi:cobyrinic acid a,c-diamide synthase [Microvirga sp. KLBC 81]|uniref:ParA family protein n=1 Tax=Microvirga sp. KLBC 81 TaxID=1862707 RepID=UPI000D513FE0|nr:ParA family protein [Microvirga sp. KLBC 81]PVE24150.1 cobyrinic acid a,c-diamide synthase [Microvirga sp. KLBC 81]